MTRSTLPEQIATTQADGDDNVVTRAQKGHLTLLDWQIANPLQEQARMPKVRRSRKQDWYQAGVITMMLSAAFAALSLLLHLAG